MNPHLFEQIGPKIPQIFQYILGFGFLRSLRKSNPTHFSSALLQHTSCEAGGDAWPNFTFYIIAPHIAFVQVLSTALKTPPKEDKQYFTY